MSDKMVLTLSRSEMNIIVGALFDTAHNEAGHSQYPDLLKAKDLPEWKMGEVLMSMMKAKGW